MTSCLPRRLLLAAVALAAFAATALPARSTVFISELMADNQTTKRAGTSSFFVDEDGDFSDWLELHNAGPTAVTLNGWYLSDSAGDLRKWQFPTASPDITLAPNERLVIWASGKNRKVVKTRLHTNFQLNKDPEYLGLTRPDGLTVEHAFSPTYPPQVQDISYGFPNFRVQALVSEAAPGKARVPLSATDMPAEWKNIGFDDSSWQAGQTGFGYDTAGTYGSLIGPGGDLQGAMYNVNATALIRVPFNVADRTVFSGLRLKMKFDDGFVAYLNGNLIASSSAPAAPTWNSSATVDRPALGVQSYLVNELPNAHTFLVDGENVLAIHLLNFSSGSTQDKDPQGAANGSRALALPVLEGNVAADSTTPAYLITATPGTPNSAPLDNFGPIINGTTRVVERPTGDANSANLVITTKVTPSLRPLKATDPVQLKFLVMFGPESSVPMRDDGVAPDVAAADGIYAAQIPTANAGVDKMIRWRVEARDDASTPAISTDPPFRDQLDNDRYFGTVTQDNITTSQLPILHWFISPANVGASQTDGGTRCSLYYLGEFYDNVFVGLHGQSSSGFPVSKKSHDFNFNEDNRFKWKEGEQRQRAVNLITTWADKSRIRDTLAWETWMTTRHIASHWASLTRVQQNGNFWGIYDLVENGDEDFLSRAGLDPDGALYKAYNSLQDAGGVEKKTRELENNSDLQALIAGLDPAKALTVRRQFAYDNVDVSSLANYLATNVLVLNNDYGHKNYYVYRDTNHTREWSVLPWDQDLALGHTWTSSQNYFDDDIHSQAGLVLGASQGNRLMNLAMTAPEMARMFLRRLRTLMDKLLVSPSETNGPLEQRIAQMLDSIDPPGAEYLTDADLDLRKWGYWVDGGGGSPVSANNTFDAATHDHGPRKQALRITSSNPNPPYPASTSNSELGNTTFSFLGGRRARLFNGNLTLLGIPIPASQPAVPENIVIEHVEYNPGSQDQEYFVIRNNSTADLDISGWSVAGAVNYTFRGGTVIPRFTSGSALDAPGDVHIGRLHVARDAAGFRQRTVSPRGGEYRFVTGGYDGQLSARGGTIELRNETGTLITSNTFTGNPTAAQTYLRVTELNYAPLAPTAQEAAALQGVQASDFEFIELTNSGADPLALGGAQFDHGISFTFPAGYTLDPGARIVLASSPAAFALRYDGTPLAGVFEGNFANEGERVRVVDPVGEVVLDFTYNPGWYAPTNGRGYTLVTRAGATAYDQYGNPRSWAISGSRGGSPGLNETDGFSQVYEDWRREHFAQVEENDPDLVGLLADPDKDLDSNFYEYCFATDPRLANGHRTPRPVNVEVSGTTYPAIRFVRPRKAVDVTYGIEVSGNLGDPAGWTALDLPAVAATDLGNGTEEVTFRDNQPAGPATRFFRVRAVK